MKSAPPPDHHSTYRPDIDGLRAIAVLSVILYHFRIGISGGYVGVDIFFVISGYLIGGIIIGESSRREFSYTRFYTRRIKRLFSAYFVVALAALAAAWWLLMPADYRAHAKSLIASTVFLSNVVFYRDAGYFDASSISKPLLHTWSLAVEEQFYLVFPLLIRAALRFGRRAAMLTLAAVAVASLALAQYLLSRDPAASFYLLPARAWEMMAGAVASQIRFDGERVPPVMGKTVTWIALAAMAATIVLFDDRTPFPGLSVLPCCLATAWLLWYGAGRQQEHAQRGLSSRLPVMIGRVSYSVYLWHWPIYVLMVYYLAGAFSWPARIVALTMTFILSIASWRYVEQPVRNSKRRPQTVICGFIAGSAILAGLGFMIWRSDGAPGRLSPELQAIARAAGDFRRDRGQCNDQHAIGSCRLGPEQGPPQFLVWGDSHARANFDGLNLAATEQGVAGLMMWAAGCPPVFDIRKVESASTPGDDDACVSQTRAVQSLLDRPSAIRNILLIGRWAYYTQGQGIGEDRGNLIRLEPASGASGGRSQAEVWTAALRDTARRLREHGYEVYVLEQVPEIPDFTSRRLFQTVRGGHESVEQAIARFGTVPRAAVDSRQEIPEKAVRELVAGGDAHVLPTHDLFCDARSCSAWGDSAPAYFDNNHLTNETSRRIRRVFVPAMRRP
ncbi:MAG TPA: acyltransferase family protein [Steroidobacteraceae bacterium]|nr:acyltransferase family protein [Steroidobacteraceae bacterium]